jgi:hypothetical protein
MRDRHESRGLIPRAGAVPKRNSCAGLLDPPSAQHSCPFPKSCPITSAIPMQHRFAPTKSWTASRFQATVIPDPAISIWEQLCSIPRSNPLPTKTALSTSCLLPDISSGCLIATKPPPYLASTRKLCNEWHAVEKSPASKLGIYGVSVHPL